MKASTAIRRQLQPSPWIGGAAIVRLAGHEVAELRRHPYGIEITFDDGTPWGGGRNLNTTLDTVAMYLTTYADPRTDAQRQADADADILRTQQHTEGFRANCTGADLQDFRPAAWQEGWLDANELAEFAPIEHFRMEAEA